MRVANILAAWLLASSAQAGGVNMPLLQSPLPQTGGFNTGLGYTGPTKAQPICSQQGTSCLFGAGPANLDLLLAYANAGGGSGGSSAPGANTGWTRVTNRGIGAGGAYGESVFCKWAGVGESATQTPSTFSNSVTIFDIVGPAGGTCASHLNYTANPSGTGSTLTVSPAASGSALVVIFGALGATGVNTQLNVVSIPTPDADNVNSPGFNSGNSMASGGASQHIVNTSFVVTASFLGCCTGYTNTLNVFNVTD